MRHADSSFASVSDWPRAVEKSKKLAVQDDGVQAHGPKADWTWRLQLRRAEKALRPDSRGGLLGRPELGQFAKGQLVSRSPLGALR